MTSPARKLIFPEASRLILNELERDTEGFQMLATLLKDVAGINLPLSDKNRTLMSSRLISILNSSGHRNYRTYYRSVVDNPEQMQEFVQALTTNTTHFFRENTHYDFLKECLPQLLDEKKKNHSSELRVWCAAASTGQEPYSIAMVLHDTLKQLQNNISVKFLATDIDLDVLKKASKGLYTGHEVENVPPALLSQHFQRSGELYAIKPHLKTIRFAQLNLLEDFPFQHKFDIIFCRNVLIYFDAKTSGSVIRKMAAVLSPEGLLFLGHSESGTTRGTDVVTVRPAVYSNHKSLWRSK